MTTNTGRALLAGALLITFAVPRAFAAPPDPAAVAGAWSASIVTGGVEIPFRFDVAARDGVLVASFFNGERPITSTASQARDGGWLFTFGQYGSVLDVAVADGRLTGEYRRGTRPPMPFRASRATRTAAAVPPPGASIAGTWIVQAKSHKGETAWRFIAREDQGVATATILRVDGDTGTLSGSFQDGRWILSHFSGARPLLLEAIPQPDGTLKLRQNIKTELVAVRATDARAGAIGEPTDPSRHTTVTDASAPFRFSFPDLQGRVISNLDPRFEGKVVLVNISGSWCPNCHDEAPFLAALYQKYRSRGLEIVTLSFEEAEQLANPARLRAFIDTYALKHTVLLAGEPEQLNERVPQAVNLNAFPTTFIIGRDGRVRGVHAGFPSPGSGEFYLKAERELSAEVERLLAERGRASQ